jgi:hypothetical protein
MALPLLCMLCCWCFGAGDFLVLCWCCWCFAGALVLCFAGALLLVLCC